jgi:TIGR03009 family protein
MSQYLAFRRLRQPRLIAVALAGILLTIGLPVFGQEREIDPGITPHTRVAQQDSDQAVTPGNRLGRASLTRPDMREERVDPDVDRLLEAWSAHTQRITNLAGKHCRSTRDFVWGTDTLAEGKFFIEMPDKGRIDLGAWTRPDPKPGDKKSYKTPDGKPVELTIKSEEKREKWICDGKIVRQIDDNRRTIDEVAIPPEQQGAHMIDGPLPFLLGMPPEKAKARYRFKILGMVGKDKVWIEVKPRLRMDAAEWVRALVVLNLKTYLPDRVSLFNSAGTSETVYLFNEIDINKRGLLATLFTGDPFKPNTWGYKREVHATAKGTLMPVVVGMSSKEALQAKEKLQAQGFKVEFEKGSKARTPAQLYRIESQDPQPNTPLRPGQKILMRYYDKYDRYDGEYRQSSRTANEKDRE